MKIDLGCDAEPRPGFEGCDIVPFEKVKHVFDFRKTDKWPFAPDSIEEIWCSHTLEHLLFEDAFSFLNKCLEVLQPGGKMTLIVPDFPFLLKEFLAADYEVRWSWWIRTIFGNQEGVTYGAKIAQLHKSGYDPAVLRQLLTEAGFRIEEIVEFYDEAHTQPAVRAIVYKP